jgi:hypothetical protein
MILAITLTQVKDVHDPFSEDENLTYPYTFKNIAAASNTIVQKIKYPA